MVSVHFDVFAYSIVFIYTNTLILNVKVLTVSERNLMPGVGKAEVYKNPEYFSYHDMSFNDAMIELEMFRLPQPNPYAPQQEAEEECEKQKYEHDQ